MGLSRGKAKALKLAAFALVGLILVPYAWIPIYRFPPAVPFSGSEFFNPYARLSGTWQRANLHAHGRAWSGLTSGRHSNEEVVHRYRELGYAVAGVSNYHEIAAYDGVPTLPLYEHGYNIGKHHQLAIGARRVEWLDLPLWQARSHLQFLINRVAATADLVALVHPVSRNAYSADDLRALTGYHLIEIVNGKFPHDEALDEALSAGRAVWGIANDDNHDLSDTDRLAVAWTMIDAPSTATADIVEALRAGRSYAVLRTGEGSTDADAALSNVTLREGGTLEVSITGAPSTISFVGQNGEVRRTVESATSATYAMQPNDPYIRAIVRAPQSTIYLNPVVRYDGRALPAPAAAIDPVSTWTLRAAALAAVVAVAVVLYRRRRPSPRRAAVAVIVGALAWPTAPADAQDLPLGAGYWADFFMDLPTSDNLFALLETMQPSLISDRFSTGGLYTGEPARIGGFLSSWTQTSYRLGDVDITDPTGSGTPLLVPELPLWNGFAAETGLHASGVGGPGLAVTLEPRRPGDTWIRDAHASLSHFGSARRSAAAPIADLRSWDRFGASLSGPLVANKFGLVASGSWTREIQDEREMSDPVRRLASGFAYLVFTPGREHEIRTIGWLQRSTRPFVYRVPFRQPDASITGTAAHVQLAWTERNRPWRVYGGYTRRQTTNDFDAAAEAEFDRLRDGPVSEIAWIAPGIVRRWMLGAFMGPRPVTAAAMRHTPRARIELDGSSASQTNFSAPLVRERVDGRPARLWAFASHAAESVRTSRTFVIEVNDRIDFADRLIIDAGVRFDSVSAMARHAADEIVWRTWLSRATARWTVAQAWRTSLFGGYRGSAYRLPLDFLAVGDPAAPTANVFAWTGGSAPATTSAVPVMRTGPGTGGAAAFSRIDEALERPAAGEIAVGIQAQPREGVLLAWTGLVRRERNLIALVNTGAPGSAYSVATIADPGADVLNPEDDRLITVYNRQPGTFAADRYLLTNPDVSDATFKGFEITFRYSTNRFQLFGGATAGIAEGLAANRGFGPLENDQSRLGELYTNPNAATFARGRLFTDRAYTVKLASVFRFRDDLRLGLIARYQDGQPFSRFLIVPNLNQGVEAVRAFPNGDSRFTYTATLDARLQKIFAAGGSRFAAFVDAYNLLNLANEVEEVTTSAPGVRIASAVQPPLAIHVGLRATF